MEQRTLVPSITDADTVDGLVTLHELLPALETFAPPFDIVSSCSDRQLRGVVSSLAQSAFSGRAWSREAWQQRQRAAWAPFRRASSPVRAIDKGSQELGLDYAATLRQMMALVGDLPRRSVDEMERRMAHAAEILGAATRGGWWSPSIAVCTCIDETRPPLHLVLHAVALVSAWVRGTNADGSTSVDTAAALFARVGRDSRVPALSDGGDAEIAGVAAGRRFRRASEDHFAAVCGGARVAGRRVRRRAAAGAVAV